MLFNLYGRLSIAEVRNRSVQLCGRQLAIHIGQALWTLTKMRVVSVEPNWSWALCSYSAQHPWTQTSLRISINGKKFSVKTKARSWMLPRTRNSRERGEKKSELGLEFKIIFVNYFQSLVINEVDEGTECEICLTDCPGFKAHEWR